MKKKEKILVAVLAVFVVVLIGIAAAIGLHAKFGDSYTSSINKAEACLDKGDYDKAVSLFQKAIEEEPEKSEAYMGLAKAYASKNYTSLAADILSVGYAKTNDQNLQEYYVQLCPGGIISDNTASDTDEDEQADAGEANTLNSGGSGSGELNTSLLEFVSRANYGSYSSKYGVQKTSQSGSLYSYSVDTINVVLNYNNTGSTNMINDQTGEPYREFCPTSVSFKNLGLVFGTGTANKITVDQIKTMQGVSILTQDSKKIVVQACGCKISITLNSDGTFSPTSSNTVEITPQETAAANHVLSGKIIDSATGEGIEGVAVNAVPDDGTDADAVETTTDGNGEYNVAIGEGEFTVNLEKDGYIETAYVVEVYSDTTETSHDFTLTQELESDVIRIVLTWNSSPRDLDSYLRGTTGDGDDIMTYFGNRVEKNTSGDVIAELDLDDVDGEGPETTTLYDMNGTYEFLVADFNTTGTMGTMGAEVEVFKGNSRIETISIDPDCVNQWRVLEIDHGEVTVVNEPMNERANASHK